MSLGDMGFDASWRDAGPEKVKDREGLPVRLRSDLDSIAGKDRSGDVPSYGVSSVKGHRGTMEDKHIAVQGIKVGGRTASMFGVFDGHGGTSCADFLAEQMGKAVKKHLEKSINDPLAALKAAFLEVDDKFINSTELTEAQKEDGSTAVVILILNGVVYCANTGDSRAVLYRAEGPLALSVDHKPTRADERQRIEDVGGCVLFNRVMGRLAVSRAFGDKTLKAFVIAEPECTQHELKEGDDFAILACDGLWDVADNDTSQKVCSFHLKAKGCIAAATALTTYAVRNGSIDNVTAIVIDLRSVVARKQSSSKKLIPSVKSS